MYMYKCGLYFYMRGKISCWIGNRIYDFRKFIYELLLFYLRFIKF